jgi:hypothetical protein
VQASGEITGGCISFCPINGKDGTYALVLAVFYQRSDHGNILGGFIPPVIPSHHKINSTIIIAITTGINCSIDSINTLIPQSPPTTGCIGVRSDSGTV